MEPLKLSTNATGISRIAAMVREARARRSASAREVALEAGVCTGTIYRLENGKTRSPHFRTVVDLLNACGFSVTSHATVDGNGRRIA